MGTLHQKLERNSMGFTVAILFVASLGGLFEIAPLFTIENTVEEVEGMRPYTPLELAGRDIYVREGCYACHSQMIRSLKSDVDRYGHFSLAAESMYDHPHQWGSKRTGPDLARIGGKYSDAWHTAHLVNPREVVEGSVMPGYAFLLERPLKSDILPISMEALRKTGVPYTDEQITWAVTDARYQADAMAENEDALIERYGDKVQVRDFDGQPGWPSEMDALVAFLQMLGTLAEFDTLDPEESAR